MYVNALCKLHYKHHLVTLISTESAQFPTEPGNIRGPNIQVRIRKYQARRIFYFRSPIDSISRHISATLVSTEKSR